MANKQYLQSGLADPAKLKVVTQEAVNRRMPRRRRRAPRRAWLRGRRLASASLRLLRSGNQGVRSSDQALGFAESTTDGLVCIQAWGRRAECERFSSRRRLLASWRRRQTWTVPDAAVAQRGLRSGQQADGFIVRLRPGWVRSGSSAVRWELKSSGANASHDCVGRVEPLRGALDFKAR